MRDFFFSLSFLPCSLLSHSLILKDLSNMSEVPSQTFRAQSSCKVLSIHTRLDKKSGARVILWRDIQRLFKHAEFIMHGQDIVLFLTDDDFEE